MLFASSCVKLDPFTFTDARSRVSLNLQRGLKQLEVSHVREALPCPYVDGGRFRFALAAGGVWAP